MAALNEYNDQTKKNIHIMVTNLCLRDCPHCCNKQYNISDIPVVTDAELREAETIFLTGGEPFMFTNPSRIATWYKDHYPNIKKVIVYTNAKELQIYCRQRNGRNPFWDIDGLDISVKTAHDYKALQSLFDGDARLPIYRLKHSRIYNFLTDAYFYSFDFLYKQLDIANVEIIKRSWQTEFEPANDSIFRRMW